MSCTLCGSDYHSVSHCPWRKNVLEALLTLCFLGASYVLVMVLRRRALERNSNGV